MKICYPFFSSLILISLPLGSLPKGMEVQSGKATVKKETTSELLIEAADRAILRFKTFQIGEKERVQFIQPHKEAAVLAKVSREAAQILGRLESNGRLFLVSPKGIVFGPNSVTHVGSLIASTLDIQEDLFKEGTVQFVASQEVEKGILQKGLIEAEESIVFLAPVILQEGDLKAKEGDIALLSAPSVLLNFSAEGRVGFILEGEFAKSCLEAVGKVEARKGDIYLKMNQREALVKELLNLSSCIEGVKVLKQNGQVVLAPKEMHGNRTEVEGDVVEVVSLKTEGSLKVEGKTVALKGDLAAKKISLTAKEKTLFEGAEIKALEGMQLAGTTSLKGEKTTLIVERGDLHLLSSLVGAGDLILQAPQGAITVDGAISTLKERFKTIRIEGLSIDQNSTVSAIGDIDYKGAIYLGGNLKTTVGNIRLEGDVVRDRIDQAIVSTGGGPGSLFFTRGVESDQAGRSILCSALDGEIHFYGPLGGKSLLDQVVVTGKELYFQDIGGVALLTGAKQLHITAEKGVSFEGEMYRALAQKWVASRFTVPHMHPLSFLAKEGDLTFDQGSFQIETLPKLQLTALDGKVIFPAIQAERCGQIEIEGKEVYLGSIGSKAGKILVKGEEVFLSQVVEGSQIQIEGQKGIVPLQMGASLQAEKELYLLSRQGSIGFLEKPVMVDVGGNVFIGARDAVVLEGRSQDFFLKTLPGFIPTTTLFNGYLYNQAIGEHLSTRPKDGGKVSLLHDVQTKSRKDEISEATITPKKGQIYYIQNG